MTQPQPRISGAHLVGSINAPDTESAFRLAALAGECLHAMPDGETGERFHWIMFQGARLDQVEGLERIGPEPLLLAGMDARPFGLVAGTDPATLQLPPLGYAEAAIRSYPLFRRLKSEGVIPEHVRFQVSLPTPVATVTTFIRPQDRAALEGPYEAALLRELEQILAAVPAEELTVQWDMALEFALLEQVVMFGNRMETWFDEPLAGLVERAARVGDAVPAGVAMGYHLCYGDVAEKHFKEPEDTAVLVDVANGLFERVGRTVDFLHLPVPIERDDEAYFAPLAELRLPSGTELYLGLLHREDGLEGAQRRIRAAGTVLDSFGVATECGMGRSPRESMADLFELHAEVCG